MPENKSSLYEECRDYFTCQTAGTHPENGIFILIREGFASWLTRDGTPMTSSGIFLDRCLNAEGERSELVNLLATIAIDKGVRTNGI